MEQVHALGHMTFSGRLEPDAKGFIAHAMARQHSGDWRNAEHIRGWARSIAEELQPEGKAPSALAEASPESELH